MKTKITKRILDAELAKGAVVKINDTDVRGFHAKITAGGSCAFYLFYRTGSGTERRPKIGSYPDLTPEAARNIAKDWLAIVRGGGDPSGDRQEARKASTIADLCDRYIKEHSKPHKKPRSIAADEQLIRANIKPALGHIKVQDLTRAQVVQFKVAREKTPFAANRCLALLSHMMSLAIVWDIRPDNPIKGVQRFKEKQRDVYFSAEELAKIHETLNRFEQEKLAIPGVLLAIRLLALTGCRCGEILALRWEDIDFGRGLFSIKDAKAGGRQQSVGAPVLAMLQPLARKSGWVVEAAADGGQLSANTLATGWKRIRSKAGLPKARLHDFRHTVATMAAQGGANAFVLRDLLGHKTIAMTARYVSSVQTQQRTVADQVADQIAAAMARPGAEIVQLPRRSG